MTPEQYITKLSRIWDDVDQHWMRDPNTLVLLNIGGEPITLKYWREMWSTAGKRFPSSLSASWRRRKVGFDTPNRLLNQLFVAFDGRGEEASKCAYILGKVRAARRKTQYYSPDHRRHQIGGKYQLILSRVLDCRGERRRLNIAAITIVGAAAGAVWKCEKTQ